MSTTTEKQQLAPRSTLRRLVASHPVLAFLVMVCALGWSTLIATFSLGLPVVLSASLGAIFGFALPAFLVTAATGGRAGVKDLLGRSLRWRVGIGWYLLAFPGLLLAALLVASVLQGSAPLEALAQKWQLFFTVFLPSLLIPLLSIQLFEETAWTGFMQDRLQERRGPLLASIMVAPTFALFHFPLSFLEAPEITLTVVRFALVLLAIQVAVGIFFRVVIMWLYNGSGRSVLIVALFHSTFNSAGTGADYTTRYIEEIISGPATLLIPIAVVAAMVAVLVTLFTRGRLAYDGPERVERRPAEVAGAAAQTSVQ